MLDNFSKLLQLYHKTLLQFNHLKAKLAVIKQYSLRNSQKSVLKTSQTVTCSMLLTWTWTPMKMMKESFFLSFFPFLEMHQQQDVKNFLLINLFHAPSFPTRAPTFSNELDKKLFAAFFHLFRVKLSSLSYLRCRLLSDCLNVCFIIVASKNFVVTIAAEDKRQRQRLSWVNLCVLKPKS